MATTLTFQNGETEVEESTGQRIPRREQQIMTLASRGLTDKEIAAKLGISAGTVNTYWRRIRLRLGAASRTEVVATVMQETARHQLKVVTDENERLQYEIACRMEAQAQVAKQEERWRSLLLSCPDVVLEVDALGGIDFGNMPVAETWALESLPFEELASSAEGRLALRNGLRRAVEGREVMRVEFETRADHETRWLEAHIGPVEGPGQGRATVVLVDRTERKRHEDELRNALNREALLTRLSGSLVASSGCRLDAALHELLDEVGLYLGATSIALAIVPRIRSEGDAEYRWTCCDECPSVDLAETLRSWQAHGPAFSFADGVVRLPLVDSGRLLGALACAMPNACHQGDCPDVEFLRLVGELLSVAVARDDERWRAERATVRLRTLLGIVESLVAATDPSEVLRHVDLQLAEVFGHDSLGLYVQDDDRGTLRPLFIVAPPALEMPLEQFSVPVGQGLIGECVRTWTPLRVNHAHRDARSVYPEGMPNVEHVMCVPVRLPAHQVGSIIISRWKDEPYEESDLDLLNVLAHFLGYAFEARPALVGSGAVHLRG